MAAPSYVPVDPTEEPRDYESPPRRPDSWWATRPGEVVGAPQPRGTLLGNQGPDLGYALKLVHLFADKIRVTEGESVHDAEAGAVAVATKRSSLFGRAPTVHDLTIGFTVWGFLDESPAPELVAARKALFEGAGHLHGYAQERAIADAVPEATLRKSPEQVKAEHQSSWRSLLTL